MSRLPACRSCGESGLADILDLGRTPLANRLLEAQDLERPEPRYPLELVRCPACGLIQITETVPPEILFGHYLYLSSVSDSVVVHAEELVGRLAARRGLDGRSLVVELASNDGYLLQFYWRLGIPVLGVEPAANVAEVAEARGIPTVVGFFGSELAARLEERGVMADVVHAHNVLAHVPDLNGFVSGVTRILRPGGILVVEVPDVRSMVERLEFDTIYHEHLCYFSVSSLAPLFARHHLALLDVEHIPIHGGSIRLVLGTEGRPSARVAAALAAESAAGVTGPGFYRDFAERVGQLCRDLVRALESRRESGRRLAAYGASAKGCTLLHHCGIGSDLIDFVVDRSPLKQGRYLPGTRIPILAPEALLTRRPDDVLLLTWNFEAEILAQQAEYRRGGGRFIVPIPQVREV